MVNDKYKIMIVAGEPSGDGHAAKLVKALRELAPAANFEFFGAASHKLREAGVEEIVNADDFSIVGLPEIAKALPMFWKDFQKLKQAAIERRPDAVILVDFPDFNLKLAKSLKKQGLKIIYYISPQLWAWRKYRASTVSKYVDLMLTILPFEKDWYAKQGISHVEFVGNPTVREVHSNLTKEQFCAKHNLDASKPVISLLAGSRHKEIVRILPALLETSARMAQQNADLQFVIALAATRKKAEFETAIEDAKRKQLKLPLVLIAVQNETHEALNASDAAAVTSGTATLETAIIGTPMAIVYKTSPLNYKLLRPLISVEHFGLINLIAEERLAKELIQDDFTAETLSEELFRLLEPETNRKMRERLKQVTDKLGHGGASKRAAEFILNVLK
ncbi:MAG TPA: lipid-A-disaccharide synthase [Pyrinomonadaceae bacterium]|nr:lipid-A-disaccharide synthase [Pyrinomonadaceae bacterium]